MGSSPFIRTMARASDDACSGFLYWAGRAEDLCRPLLVLQTLLVGRLPCRRILCFLTKPIVTRRNGALRDNPGADVMFIPTRWYFDGGHHRHAFVCQGRHQSSVRTRKSLLRGRGCGRLLSERGCPQPVRADPAVSGGKRRVTAVCTKEAWGLCRCIRIRTPAAVCRL